MSHRKIVLLFLVSLALVGGSYLFANSGIPDSLASSRVSLGLDDSIPDPSVKTTDGLIEFWRGRVERDPQDYISLAYLGQSFLRQGRETGDISAYQRAETALHEALALNSNYEAALAYLGAVLFAQHDFQGAKDLANRVYSFDPRALQALATLGDAQVELGNYVEAEAAYSQLLELSPSPPVYSRLARLAWLQGRPEEAQELMRMAADESVTLGLTGDSVAWYQFQLGELYFSTGQIEDAAEHYANALDLFDNYYLALAGLGRVRAAQGGYEEAIDLYQRAIAIIPQPATLAALGDLYAKTGDVEQAQRQYDTVEFIATLAAINQQVYNRELALFYANHDLKLEYALELASAELEFRRDIYGYDALAWTLYQNHRFDEAAQAMDQSMKLGTKDATLYFHSGMIQYRLGNEALAREHLSSALNLNPYFSILHSSLARQTLSELGS